MMELSDKSSLILDGHALVNLYADGKLIWGEGSAYEQLEYVYFEGNSYIDTGYLPIEYDDGAAMYSITLKLNAENSGAHYQIFGSSDGTNYSSGIGFYNNTKVLSVHGGTVTANRIIREFCNQKVTVCSATTPTYICFRTDVENYTGEVGQNFSGEMPTTGTVYVGSVSGKDPQFKMVGEIYEFIVAEYSRPLTVPLTNKTYRLHLVPCRRVADGEVGMYDLVSDTFFTNAGEGTLTAGPVVGMIA